MMSDMKVMFVSGGFESIGIEYLSAVLKQNGFKTQLAFDPQLFNDPFLRIKGLDAFFSWEKQIIKEIIG